MASEFRSSVKVAKNGCRVGITGFSWTKHLLENVLVRYTDWIQLVRGLHRTLGIAAQHSQNVGTCCSDIPAAAMDDGS